MHASNKARQILSRTHRHPHSWLHVQLRGDYRNRERVAEIQRRAEVCGSCQEHLYWSSRIKSGAGQRHRLEKCMALCSGMNFSHCFDFQGPHCSVLIRCQEKQVVAWPPGTGKWRTPRFEIRCGLRLSAVKMSNFSLCHKIGVYFFSMRKVLCTKLVITV